jgi:putative NADH-flavin reductase
MGKRLLVLGATGKTGSHFVELALSRGHRVTAFVRSPEKIGPPPAGLTVVKGQALETDQLARAMSGHDAVVSTLGPSSKEAFRPSTLMTECAASTVSAMKAAGVGRLAILSAAVMFPERSLRFMFFRAFLRHHLRDLTSMEAVVRATDFDWTIARPPRLVQAPSEAYRSAKDALPPRSGVMSFRAVAAFMLDSLEQDSTGIVGLGAA